LGVKAAEQAGLPNSEWLFTLPAFYAEFAPLRHHGGAIDHLYVLKDRGLLTADRRAFASPLWELSFTFRSSSGMADLVPKVVVVQPSFGHRTRKQAFHGWAFGVRGKLSGDWLSAADCPPLGDCQARLAQAIRGGPSCTDVLSILDRLLDGLTRQSSDRPGKVCPSLDGSQFQVGRLASLLGHSARTLQRRMRTATGLPPKRFLSLERFRRAVHEVPMRDAELSLVATHLGFSDQAHLTREFRRHAGLTPGAFQRAWQGARGNAVRFVQDSASPTRLRIAVWAPEDHH
jgi:AraC-like DNA-binding protein